MDFHVEEKRKTYLWEMTNEKHLSKAYTTTTTIKLYSIKCGRLNGSNNVIMTNQSRESEFDPWLELQSYPTPDSRRVLFDSVVERKWYSIHTKKLLSTLDDCFDCIVKIELHYSTHSYVTFVHVTINWNNCLSFWQENICWILREQQPVTLARCKYNILYI